MITARKPKQKYDYTWGIDRNEASQHYGKLVLGGKNMLPIILWSRPGAPIDSKNVKGALPHNERVKVIKTLYYKGKPWAKVSKTVDHDGRKYPQVGWLSATLLKKLGVDDE